MLEHAKGNAANDIGVVPAKGDVAKDLPRLVERPAVDVEDAKLFAKRFRPLLSSGWVVPFPSPIWLVDGRIVSDGRGFDLLEEEVAQLIYLGVEVCQVNWISRKLRQWPTESVDGLVDSARSIDFLSSRGIGRLWAHRLGKLKFW